MKMTHKLIKKGALHLYGPVGGSFLSDDGFTASEVQDALGEFDGDEIDVHINSGGGLAFDGLAIYNALRASEKLIRVYVDAIAASAASVIAMAGDEIHMAEGAMMMIHDASGITMGNAADHQKTAAVLDKLDDQMAGIYSRRGGKNRKYWRDAMDDETWMDAADAIHMGFPIIKTGEDAAEPTAFAYHQYKNAPENLPLTGGDFIPAAASVASFTAAIRAAQPPVTMESDMADKPVVAAAPTVDSLKADHSAVYDAIYALGVKAERERVAAIMELAAPGADKVIAAAIADGSDAGSAAKALLAFERGARAAAATAIVDDEKKVAGLRSEQTPDTGSKPSAGMAEGEAKWKAEWAEMSAADRQPFIAGEKSYLALRRRQARAA